MGVLEFRAAHEADWRRLERILATARDGKIAAGPVDGTELFHLLDRIRGQLDEARKRFRDPVLTGYLRDLVARANGLIEPDAPDPHREAAVVPGFRYGHALRRTAPFVLVAIGVFLAAFGAGTLRGLRADPRERADILSPRTRENLMLAAQGRSLRVEPPPGTTSHLFTHNAGVAVLGFASGIAGVGPLYFAVSNGFRLGSSVGAFHSVGQGDLWWSIVAPHGFLELAAICTAWGAGLRMGWTLIRSSRGRRATVQGILESAAVAATGVPALAIAAVIEGRVTDVPSLRPAVTVGVGLALVYLTLILVVPLLRSFADSMGVVPETRATASREDDASVAQLPHPKLVRFSPHIQARFRDVARGGERFREAWKASSLRDQLALRRTVARGRAEVNPLRAALAAGLAHNMLALPSAISQWVLVVGVGIALVMAEVPWWAIGGSLLVTLTAFMLARHQHRRAELTSRRIADRFFAPSIDEVE